jgi:hypothetical protein
MLISLSGSIGITDFLSYASSVFTWLMTQMTALVSFISSNPIILLMVIVSLSGLVIAVFSRVFHSLG